jgi:putative transposase
MISSESRQGWHNFVSNRLHLVFRIRRGFPSIPDNLQLKLWAYMGGIAKRMGLVLYQVGGAKDHVHVFFGLPASVTLASVVQKFKLNSSGWIRQHPNMGRFEWQEGYGAFSVSVTHTDVTMAYIRGQKEQHAKRDFDAEMRVLMEKHGVVPTGLGTWVEE